MVVTEDWYFLSHRLLLALAAKAQGLRVVIATGPGRHSARILDAGLEHRMFALERKSTNPVGELRTIASLTVLMREIRPSVVHLVAAKPIVYGNIAAVFAGWPKVLCAVAGLGYLYLGGGRARAAMRRVFETTFKTFVRHRSSTRVLVQNCDDADLLLSRGMAAHSQIIKTVGVGVDICRFVPSPEPPSTPIVILAHTRMLWDKGIGELVEAVRMLRNRPQSPPVLLRLVGDPDEANPASISREQLQAWNSFGSVEWLGRRSDITEQLRQCHIACLPSYREGTPLSLLEAAAVGRAIVTTDVPGCREVVRHEHNGLLVPPRDVMSLARALEKLAIDGQLRSQMGKASRYRAEEEFSSNVINARVLGLYEEMVRR